MLDLTATAKFVAASEKISTFPNAPPGLIDENTEKIIDAARRELDRGYQGPEELNLRRLQLSGWSVEDLMAHLGVTDINIAQKLLDKALAPSNLAFLDGIMSNSFASKVKELNDPELINRLASDLTAEPQLLDILIKNNELGWRIWKLLTRFPNQTESLINLELFIDLSPRFSFEDLSGIEAIERLLSQISIDKFPDLVNALKNNELQFNGLSDLKVILVSGDKIILDPEIPDEVLRGQGLPPEAYEWNNFNPNLVTPNTVELFEEQIDQLIQPYIDPNKPGARIVLGIDNSTYLGNLYPTRPGILDVHVHGQEPSPNVEKPKFSVKSSAGWYDLDPDELAWIIASHPSYSEINAINLFACFGIQNDAVAIAKWLKKPIIASTNKIHVNQDGTMFMESGQLYVIIPSP